MSIWIVLTAKCSDLGFTDIKVLGSFMDEEDAKEFKKKQYKDIHDNYRLTIHKSYLSLKSLKLEIPESAKLGYD